MREIEKKPIPTKSRGLTGDLLRLADPNDSFVIEVEKRGSVYSTASRLGMRLITRVEDGGLRVWRNFDVAEDGPQPDYRLAFNPPVESSKADKLAELRTLIGQPQAPLPEAVAEWAFTKDAPQYAEDGNVYRKQVLLPAGKRFRTVRVSEDSHDTIIG